jgi:hypothetical protein
MTRHFWTEETVSRNANSEGIPFHEWVLNKQREFEKRTGVRWSAEQVHAGYNFLPTDEGIPPMPSVSPDTERKIRNVYLSLKGDGFSGYVTYFEVWEKTSWDLKGLAAAIKNLEKQGKARRTINRMGKGVCFKLVD